ncbi:MAG: hypothetical protein IPG93_19745 [Burkholderiales bacterium]|nr:hypothetical protein [Burkholderiales bacterium]
MTAELDTDGHRVSPSTWMRWRLIWRVHYGTPAALALILWIISVPLAITVYDRYTVQRAAKAAPAADPSAATPGGSANPGGVTTGVAPLAQASSAAPAPAVAPASSALPAATALAAALAAGDAALIEALPTTAQRGADLGALITAARNAGLAPSQADYALETGAIRGLARLRVDLPVRGSGAQLARFMTMLDAQLPNAVVESLDMTPAGPRQPLRSDAHLHLVLFYRAPA